MITKVFSIYNFDELSKKIQKKVIEVENIFMQGQAAKEPQVGKKKGCGRVVLQPLGIKLYIETKLLQAQQWNTLDIRIKFLLLNDYALRRRTNASPPKANMLNVAGSGTISTATMFQLPEPIP